MSFVNRIKKFFDEGDRPEPAPAPAPSAQAAADASSEALRPKRPKKAKQPDADSDFGRAITEPLDCDRGCKKWHLPRPKHIVLTEIFMSKGPSLMTFSATCPHCKRLLIWSEKDKPKISAEIIAYERRHRVNDDKRTEGH